MKTVAFATCSLFPDLADDDRLALAPLRERGIAVEPVLWDDRAAAWEKYDAVIIRSTWDYYLHIGDFTRWLDRIHAAGVPLFNPYPVVSWNKEKSYLRELERKGVSVVPARWLEKGTDATLEELIRSSGWEKIVVKPAVSAGGHRTTVFTADAAEKDEAEFQSELRQDTLIVQPFLEEITTEGEWALIFFDGAFSHAVIKKPKAGDFRVQEKHGGTSRRADPPPAVLEEARRILGMVETRCLYARVDGVITGGKLRLMELELLEPSLFLGLDPEAPSRFASAIAARL